MSLDQLPFARPTLLRAGSAIRGARGHRFNLRVKRRTLGRYAAIAILAVLSAQSFVVAALYNHNLALIVAWPILMVVAFWRPMVAMLAAGVILRIAFASVCCTDQISVSQAAWDRVASGLGGPYGVGYAATDPPGAPFPYGPLGLIWWLPGPIVELAAATAVMGVLAWQRAYITLAIYAAWQPVAWLSVAGANDYSPGLLVLLAVIALPSRPVVGAAILAIAAALKPYAFAWFLPAVGFGGMAAALTLAVVTAVAWSPMLLLWGGLGPFLDTIRLAAKAHPTSNAFDIQPLRWVALPVGIAATAVKRWEWGVLLGSLAFVLFLFLDRWASYSYWFAVIPATGLAIESLLNLTTVRHPAGRALPDPLRFPRNRWSLPPRQSADRG